jgi:hypothetical protein
MLRAGQEMLVDLPPFQSEIGWQGQIAIYLGVGSLYFLFPASGVVHDKPVNIKRDVAGGKSCQGCPDLLQKLDGCPGNCREKRFSMFIHPLAHGSFRGNLGNTKGLTEKVVVSILFHGHKIALCLGKYPTVTLDDICMGDTV